MRIVLCYPVEPRHVQQIQAAAPAAEIVDAGQERIDELLPTADIFCGHAKVPVDWERVVAAGRLRWIQSSAAGMDHCLVPCVVESSILVTSASGVFAAQVAEQTMALLLGFLRRLHWFHAAQQRREFERLPTDDLRGKTVGIVGLGGNGRRIAEVLSVFGVTIIATDRFPHDCPPAVSQVWPADALPQLMAQADIIVLCIPLNDETDGLIDHKMLALCKPSAILVNVARGRVVRESALVDALLEGRLGGAALDVTETEPLPTQSRLWDLPNVIITPHVGAQSSTRVDDATALFCENLMNYREGRPLRNVVDKRLGFPIPSLPSPAR